MDMEWYNSLRGHVNGEGENLCVGRACLSIYGGTHTWRRGRSAGSRVYVYIQAAGHTCAHTPKGKKNEKRKEMPA